MKPRFENKKEAFDFFEEQIARAYDKLYTDKKLEFESYLLKTYILEVNMPLGQTLQKFLEDNFSFHDKKEKKKISPSVEVIEEDFFEITYAPLKTVLYVEQTDNRFLFAYTLSSSKLTEPIIGKIVNQNPLIDRLWLWDKFLHRQIKLYKRYFKGFSFDYDFRPLAKKDNEETMSYLKMQLWGGGKELQDFFEIVRNKFPSITTLGRI